MGWVRKQTLNVFMHRSHMAYAVVVTWNTLISKGVTSSRLRALVATFVNTLLWFTADSNF